MKTFYKPLLAIIIIVLGYGANAQTPIVTVTTTDETSPTSTTYNATGANGSSFSSTNFNYTFGTATQASGNIKRLSSFTIGSDEYTYSQNANSFVKIRRVNNATVAVNRDLVWVEKAAIATATSIAVVNPYNDNMESVFDGNSLNQGTDNLFANQGDGNGNNNNIERLDVIFSGGILSTSSSKVGFALFERGADNAHDPFVIAAITAVDIDGNPTAYGNPLRVATTDYGNLPASTINYYVARRDAGVESTLRMSTSGTQNIGGVFISLNDLGIATEEKIYGYSIIAYDLPAGATGADLVDYTNSTFFPTNTSSATTQGGIDLIALTGVLSTPEVLILPPTAYNIEMPTMLNISPITQMLPLSATAASGTIASYTISTIPPTSQGVVYLCNDLGCNPVTEGQVLAPAQINQLFFQPNPAFSGNVVFYYTATDTYDQVSNTASYTIPVIAQTQGPLPVRIVSFSGSIDKKLVQLNWQTAQEMNSSHFEIQRSADGNNFEPIASITAKGNSNDVSGYQLTDDLFFYLKNIVFYRLKMVDIDGKFKYSAVIMIRLNNTSIKTAVHIWPNPFISQLNVEYNADANEAVKINFINAEGKTVVSNTSRVRKGSNAFAISQAQQLPRGTYVLQIISATKTENIKVIKQ